MEVLKIYEYIVCHVCLTQVYDVGVTVAYHVIVIISYSKSWKYVIVVVKPSQWRYNYILKYNYVIAVFKFFWKVLSRNIPMDFITWFDKIICDDSNLKKRICLINVLTVALFSCLEMICEFRHLKFFKLLWDHVNLLNQLYWYFWLYCKKNCTKYIPVFLIK